MNYRATENIKMVKPTQIRPSRSDMAKELKLQADILRDQGKTAAEFWVADQYEKTAALLN
jgi:hypothetical protein